MAMCLHCCHGRSRQLRVISFARFLLDCSLRLSSGRRSSHRNLPPSSDGLSASTIWTSSSLAKPRSPSSLATQAGSPLLDNGSCVEPCSPLYQGKHVGRTRTRGRDATLRRQASRGGSAATGELAKVSGPSFLGRKPKVTVRQAKERDYQGVAEIRGVIIPVGMSGATGFLGGKVVIDDPAEAERRLLMAKVCACACVDSAGYVTTCRCRRCCGDFLVFNILSLS